MAHLCRAGLVLGPRDSRYAAAPSPQYLPGFAPSPLAGRPTVSMERNERISIEEHGATIQRLCPDHPTAMGRPGTK